MTYIEFYIFMLVLSDFGPFLRSEETWTKIMHCIFGSEHESTEHLLMIFKFLLFLTKKLFVVFDYKSKSMKPVLFIRCRFHFWLVAAVLWWHTCRHVLLFEAQVFDVFHVKFQQNIFFDGVKLKCALSVKNQNFVTGNLKTATTHATVL